MTGESKLAAQLPVALEGSCPLQPRNTAYGLTNVPPGLSNVIAVGAWYGHSLA
jgi:hypothetical protein